MSNIITHIEPLKYSPYNNLNGAQDRQIELGKDCVNKVEALTLEREQTNSKLTTVTDLLWQIIIALGK
jgi:hypothetical protein